MDAMYNVGVRSVTATTHRTVRPASIHLTAREPEEQKNQAREAQGARRQGREKSRKGRAKTYHASGAN
eukprot:1508547-Pyramimonas_sp.AAC.1